MAFKVSAAAPMSHDVPGDVQEAGLTAELHRLNSREEWQVETLSCFIIQTEGGESVSGLTVGSLSVTGHPGCRIKMAVRVLEARLLPREAHGIRRVGSSLHPGPCIGRTEQTLPLSSWTWAVGGPSRMGTGDHVSPATSTTTTLSPQPKWVSILPCVSSWTQVRILLGTLTQTWDVWIGEHVLPSFRELCQEALHWSLCLCQHLSLPTFANLMAAN